MASEKGNGGAASDLHISDVLEVIEHDPEYTGQAQHQATARSASAASNLPPPSSASTLIRSIEAASMLNTTSAMVDPDLEAKRRAFVKILEQPASKALRFRYECEGRSAGSIPGAKSTTDTKTYPTIQVVGYRGRAVVVVSCVTKDVPYRPHPHSLVGKEGCKKGVCTLEINNENMTCTFSNLGIQCVKKKGIEEALKQREEIRVDPFHTGFAHRNQPQAIDLNAVRLCFQVFLEGAQRGKFTFPLKPLVSDPIFDKKAMCDLTICKLSDFTSTVTGGKEIIMLCDKVTKDDIQVRFYQEVDGQLEWEGFGEFGASDVHKQVAISFRTPRYKNVDIDGPLDVWVQLRRPSDGATSESRPFQFVPMDTGSIVETPLTSAPHLISKHFKPDFQLYSHILAADSATLARKMFRVAIPGTPTGPMAEFPGRIDRPRRSAAIQCNFPHSSLGVDAQTNVTVDELVPCMVSERGTASVSLPMRKSPSVEMISTSFIEPDSPLARPVDAFILDTASKPVRPAQLPVEPIEMPPPLPQKGLSLDKLRETLNKKGAMGADSPSGALPSYAKVQKGPLKSVNFERASVSTVLSDCETDSRFSVASSEDLNSRLSAAFSEFSDLTDVHSVYSEADASDVISLISSTHTLNDRLSLLSVSESVSDGEISDSDQTVIDGRSNRTSIDAIERQLEMLQSMSVDQDFQTYSSFQMAMKHPLLPSWSTKDDVSSGSEPAPPKTEEAPTPAITAPSLATVSVSPTEAVASPSAVDETEDKIKTERPKDAPTSEDEDESEIIQVDLVYDDPDSEDVMFATNDTDFLGIDDEAVALPAVPPRVESMVAPAPLPPLPPRRFKKINQPLPDPPGRDLGLKGALLALKQTFMKVKPGSKGDTSSNASQIGSSQENLSKAAASYSPEANDVNSGDQENPAEGAVAISSSPPAVEVATGGEIAAIPATDVDALMDQDPADTLTEAESFALYMRLAPLATTSEFDDGETMSALYAELTPTREAAKAIAAQGN